MNAVNTLFRPLKIRRNFVFGCVYPLESFWSLTFRYFFNSNQVHLQNEAKFCSRIQIFKWRKKSKWLLVCQMDFILQMKKFIDRVFSNGVDVKKKQSFKILDFQRALWLYMFFFWTGELIFFSKKVIIFGLFEFIDAFPTNGGGKANRFKI